MVPSPVGMVYIIVLQNYFLPESDVVSGSACNRAAEL